MKGEQRVKTSQLPFLFRISLLAALVPGIVLAGLFLLYDVRNYNAGNPAPGFDDTAFVIAAIAFLATFLFFIVVASD